MLKKKAGYPPFPMGQVEAGRAKRGESSPVARLPSVWKSVPPHQTPEGLNQCALGANSWVYMERSWLEGWKCCHRHFLLFSFHLWELQPVGNEAVTGKTALYGTCPLARDWASPRRHRHMRITGAGPRWTAGRTGEEQVYWAALENSGAEGK